MNVNQPMNSYDFGDDNDDEYEDDNQYEVWTSIN